MGYLKDIWNAMSNAQSPLSSSSNVIDLYLTQYPEVKAKYDAMGLQFSVTDLPSGYDSTPYNTVLPGGIVVHTVGEYKQACADYWKNNVE